MGLPFGQSLIFYYGVGVVTPARPVHVKYLAGLAEPAVVHVGLPFSSDPVILTTSTNQLNMCETPSVGRIVAGMMYFVSVTWSINEGPNADVVSSMVTL